jgi:tetratricopeptide (TPR) repeat protein
MKRWLFIVSLFAFTISAFAQDEMRTIDSLESVMAKQEGREKVETMIELSYAFFEFSFDDCINWGERAIEDAVCLHDDELIAKSYLEMGNRYLDHFEFDLAYEQFVNALKYLKEKGDSELLEDVLNSKGWAELFMGEIDSALATYQSDLELSERLDDIRNYADVINNIAYIHFQQNDFDKAMECFQDARQRYEHVQDTLSVAQCDNNISNIYVQWQQYDEALTLLQKAIPVFEQNEDEASLAHAYQNLGTIYATGHVNLDSALVYLRKSISCAEMVGDQVTLVEDEIELANVLKLLNRNSEAIGLYQSALHSSETMGFLNGMLGAYKNLGIYYNETGDFTTSAIYLKRCMDLASEKGNQLFVNSVRPYLIADYAHMGHFAEMKKELGLFTDDYESILNESSLLDEELAQLRDNAAGLLQQYESQNNQIPILQKQRNHYRLAFFGLLTIVLAALVFISVYKFVRKKRTKV